MTIPFQWASRELLWKNSDSKTIIGHQSAEWQLWKLAHATRRHCGLLADGSQRTYTPAEFAKTFNWKNDPEKAELLGK